MQSFIFVPYKNNLFTVILRFQTVSWYSSLFFISPHKTENIYRVGVGEEAHIYNIRFPRYYILRHTIDRELVNTMAKSKRLKKRIKIFYAGLIARS